MIYKILNELNIKYEEISHNPVYTVEEAKKIEDKINGIGCKNLFIKDKNNYYLLIMEENKKANFKYIQNKLNTGKLTFSTEDELHNILGLSKGSCTPFGIINDINNIVKLIIDKDLMDKKLLFHPNVNTKTISLNYDDLIKFIEYKNHEYISMGC